MRGLYLRSWRYSSETDRLVEEASEREHWSTEQWQLWRENRLAYVLHRAATQVPYYREQWAQRRRCGDTRSWEDLQHWPILEKEPLRQYPKAFVAEDCDPRRMFHEHTSGTTGKSLDLWWSQTTVREFYALYEARFRGWHGVSRHDRWAILGGQLVVPVSRRRPPFWVWNVALNQLYMSSYHLAPDLIPYYLDALSRYRARYILGYPSALYALAQTILETKRRDVRMVAILTNAEPLFPYQREVIAEAFQCSVGDSYGMAEGIVHASECPNGVMHLWPELGVLEVLTGHQIICHSGSGDLLGTSLLNADMPLIRYHIGDSGVLPDKETNCECGRSLPSLTSVEGRTDDVLYTMDGRRVGRLDPVFKSQLPIREAQIIQETLSQVRIRYVPTPDFTEDAARSMVHRLQDRMGSVEVVLEQVSEVPRGANGKFRTVVCALSAQERAKMKMSGDHTSAS